MRRDQLGDIVVRPVPGDEALLPLCTDTAEADERLHPLGVFSDASYQRAQFARVIVQLVVEERAFAVNDPPQDRDRAASHRCGDECRAASMADVNEPARDGHARAQASDPLGAGCASSPSSGCAVVPSFHGDLDGMNTCADQRARLRVP